MDSPEKPTQWLPDREHLQEQYNAYTPDLKTLLERLEIKLKSNIIVSSTPTYKARVKGFNSYYRKLLRNLPEGVAKSTDLPVITDIIGIRIICAFLQDLIQVEKILYSIFTVY